MKRTRSYDMAGRRLIEVLRIGGARKHNVLRAILGGEEQLQRALARLGRRIRSFRRQGGIHYELSREKT